MPFKRKIWYPIDKGAHYEIPLSQSRFAIIDKEDLDKIKEISWYYDGKYASGSIKRKRIRIHSLIMNTPKGMETDHIDGNKLNNRKSNLRICTTQENMCNLDLLKRNRSGYKGVSFDKFTMRWIVRIRYNGKYLFIGRFDNIEDAHKAYKSASLKYHNNFSIFKKVEK